MKQKLASRLIDNLAIQLDRDPGVVDPCLRPSSVVRRDLAHDADDARGAVQDGDEVTDRPLLAARLQTAVNDSLGPIQRH